MWIIQTLVYVYMLAIGVVGAVLLLPLMVITGRPSVYAEAADGWCDVLDYALSDKQ